MAWDEAAARQFAGGLANSFFMGRDPRGYQNAQLAEEEMALRRAQDARLAAQNAREQAVHDARMREVNRTYGLTDEIINASSGAGLPIPEGQMGGDGFGPPTPAGLKTPELSPAWLRQKSMQLAAAKGDLDGITKLRQEDENTRLDQGLARHMADWRKLTLEQKLALPWVRQQFNENPNVPGELAIDKKGKLVLTNADGRGTTKFIDPDLLDRAAAAYFLEQNGRGGAALKGMADAGADYYTRGRERTKDNNLTMTQLHRARIDEGNLDVNRAQLGLQQTRANKPVWQQFIGADNKPVLVDMNAVDKDPATGMAKLPPGVQFPKQTIDAATQLRYRSELIKQGMPPEEVDREMARVMGAPDPLEKLVGALKEADKGAGKAASGAPRQETTKNPASAANMGLRIPESMPGKADVPRTSGAGALKQWWSGGQPQKPLLDYMIGR
jgi:hypothetical protein